MSQMHKYHMCYENGYSRTSSPYNIQNVLRVMLYYPYLYKYNKCTSKTKKYIEIAWTHTRPSYAALMPADILIRLSSFAI